jgi:MFS family permease
LILFGKKFMTTASDRAAVSDAAGAPGAATGANPDATPDASQNTLQETAVDKLSGTFYLMWFGQFISALGSGLTSFGFGVWLFQRTHSILDFAIMSLCGTLPALLVTPWAGSVADRLDKRRILMGSDALAALGIGSLGLLLWQDALHLWHLYLVQALLSMGLAFQGAAGQATITRIVPKKLFGQAGGLFAISQAVAVLTGPFLGAALISGIGLDGVLAIDFTTFMVALLCLALAVFPPNTSAATFDGFFRQPLQDFRQAASFFRQHPTMTMIYGYTALGGFLAGIVTVLVTPLVLSTNKAYVLAQIATSAGAGALVGGILMAVWGGPKRWTPQILGLSLVEGLAVAIAGYVTAPAARCVAAFAVMFSSALLTACVLAVWRRKVPMAQQGSVVALQRAIDLSLLPLSALVGGGLANYLFEPALLPGGRWYASVGSWFGTGAGRGTGLLFCVVGGVVALVSLMAMQSGRLRRLEEDVPDAF